MAVTQIFKLITEANGRQTYVNLQDIRTFYNYESKLIIEMIDGTVYEVLGAPAVVAFFNSTFTVDPTEVTITNSPIPTKEQLTNLTLTSSVVTVAAVDTLVLAANPNRKYLLIQRGTTVGRVFVKFSAGAATVTNGVLFRENAYYKLPSDGYIYTGEIRAIAVGSSKILYVTEGVG